MEIISKLEKISFLDIILNFISNTILVFIRRIYIKDKNVSERIVVVALHKLGDTVFTIPALKALKIIYKDIIVFCFSDSKLIYDLQLNGFQYVVVDKADISLGGRYISKNYRLELKKLKPSKIYDITGNVLSASLIFNSATKDIVGLDNKYLNSIYSKIISKRKQPPLIDMYLDLVKADNTINENLIERKYKVSYDKSSKMLNSSICRMGC